MFTSALILSHSCALLPIIQTVFTTNLTYIINSSDLSDTEICRNNKKKLKHSIHAFTNDTNAYSATFGHSSQTSQTDRIVAIPYNVDIWHGTAKGTVAAIIILANLERGPSSSFAVEHT